MNSSYEKNGVKVKSTRVLTTFNQFTLSTYCEIEHAINIHKG